jgi:hypothetical protein
MTPSSEQTFAQGPGTSAAVLERYHAVWLNTFRTGGPPPDRDRFLADGGPDRAGLEAILGQIDGAYARLRDLFRSGTFLVAPAAPDPSPAAQVVTANPSQYAGTIEAAPGGAAEAGLGISGHCETIDTAAFDRTATTAVLGEGTAIGGHELLGVLAHGGMGVVYKARHTRLDRFAAIKMVLAGAHASAHQLARFRAEAQVVANLQHPNIVQLYEIGEHDGLPYLALEFVDGGSLAHKAADRLRRWSR